MFGFPRILVFWVFGFLSFHCTILYVVLFYLVNTEPSWIDDVLKMSSHITYTFVRTNLGLFSDVRISGIIGYSRGYILSVLINWIN